MDTQSKINQLTTQVEAQSKVVAELHSQLDILRDKTIKEVKKLNSLTEERDSLVLSQKINKDEIDFDLILEGDTGSSVRYKEQKRQLGLLGLGSSGYYPETGQAAIRIALYRNKEKKNKKAYSSLVTLLPYIKDIDGCKCISIFEHSLSRYGSYYLKVEGATEDSSCYISKSPSSRWGKEVSFNNLKEAFEYIKEHLYYE